MLPFLIALQASGMVVDYLGRRSAADAARKGYKLQQQQIQKAIELSRLQTAQESLSATQDLRRNLGAQAVILAARGQKGGVLSMTESVSNYNTDERLRQLNQESNESKLRLGMEMSKLEFKTFKNNQWNSFIKGSLEKVSTSDAFKGLGSSFGLNKVNS